MTNVTHLCPPWCTWQDNEIHIAGDWLAAEPGTIIRSHARSVQDLTIAGRPLGVDLTQEEYIRGEVVERGPVTVYLGEVEPMTPEEARQLAAILLQAASEAEAVAR